MAYQRSDIPNLATHTLPILTSHHYPLEYYGFFATSIWRSSRSGTCSRIYSYAQVAQPVDYDAVHEYNERYGSI